MLDDAEEHEQEGDGDPTEVPDSNDPAETPNAQQDGKYNHIAN